MAVYAFLKVDGVPGESTDDRHKDWIEALSFSWGIDPPTTVPARPVDPAIHRRPDFRAFCIKKVLDKASPILTLACAERSHLKDILLELCILELCRADGEKTRFMEYKLSDCTISSISVAGGTDVEPVETVTFSYGKIELTYIQQERPDGSGGGTVAAGWDLEANRKL